MFVSPNRFFMFVIFKYSLRCEPKSELFQKLREILLILLRGNASFLLWQKYEKKLFRQIFPDNNLLSAYTYLFCVFEKAEKVGILIRAAGFAFLNGTKKLGKTFAHSENCRYLCSRFAANRCKSYPNKPN